MAVAAMMVATSAYAQRLQVIDSKGNGIPYVLAMNSDGKYIGITDLDGVLADVGEESQVVITHMAYKTKDVKLDKKEIVVTLEDADYEIPKLSVQQKPYIYVQTYYRMFFFTSAGDVRYYRAGLTDNAYDFAKKTVEAQTNAVSKANDVITKINFDKFKKQYDQFGQFDPLRLKLEEKLKERAKPIELSFTNMASNKQRISDDRSIIGYIIDDLVNQKRYCFTDGQYIMLRQLELKGTGKEKQMWEKSESRVKNRKRVNSTLYNYNSDGNVFPEDRIMCQFLNSYDWYVNNYGDLHCIVVLQVFTTERSYVTKSELKERQKSNKIKMDYLNIRQFENDHNIPSLPRVIQQGISKLWGTIE